VRACKQAGTTLRPKEHKAKEVDKSKQKQEGERPHISTLLNTHDYTWQQQLLVEGRLSDARSSLPAIIRPSSDLLSQKHDRIHYHDYQTCL
jgi:hypothetical protein